MKYKTAELEGALLDAAVAKALGKSYITIGRNGCWAGATHQDQDGGFFAPSSRWDQGGPIIERESLELLGITKERWQATNLDDDCEYGPTLLIAAMRAYVRSKFGEEVELP